VPHLGVSSSPVAVVGFPLGREKDLDSRFRGNQGLLAVVGWVVPNRVTLFMFNYVDLLINHQLINQGFLATTAILGLLWLQPAQAEIMERIDTTGVLKVGIRQNVLPLGQRQEGQWTGYCADIADALAKHLSRDRASPIQVLFITSTTQSRYSLVANGTVDMECGPNTINPETEAVYGVRFSAPFFITATQILSRPHSQGAVGVIPSPPLLGVIKDTTNEADINQVYPRGQINNAFPDYERGINAVLGGQISGFASDGILLVETARRLNLELNRDYVLTTLRNDFGNAFCASYGMILPGGADDSRWRNMVNFFLSTHREAKNIWRRWFSRVDASIEEVSSLCR